MEKPGMATTIEKVDWNKRRGWKDRKETKRLEVEKQEIFLEEVVNEFEKMELMRVQSLL